MLMILREIMNLNGTLHSLRKHIFKIFVILTLAALVAGFFVMRSKSGSVNSAPASGHKIVVGDIEEVVTAQGKLEPKEYVDVGTQVSGQLKNLYVAIGDVVKKGDVLAEIDPRIYESRVEADRAKLKSLEAQLNEQKAQFALSQKVLERNKRLIEKKAISQQVLEESQADIQISEAKIESIKAQMDEVSSTLNGNITNLAYTKIYSPIDGTIVDQSAKEGQTVNASQTAPIIMQVANLDIMTVRTQVSEADVPKISEGLPVYFTTLGSTRRWVGKVRQVLPSPQTVNDVVLYNVLIDVENSDRSLMTGMSAQAFFVLGSTKGVPVIPMEYLKTRAADADNDEGEAYKIMVKGKPKLVTVHIGITNRISAEIKSGLEVGDVIQAQPTASEKPKNKRDAGGGGFGNRGPQL